MSAKTPIVDALLSRRIVDIKTGVLMDKILVDGRPTDLLDQCVDLARALEAHCEAMAEAIRDHLAGKVQITTTVRDYERFKRQQLGTS